MKRSLFIILGPCALPLPARHRLQDNFKGRKGFYDEDQQE